MKRPVYRTKCSSNVSEKRRLVKAFVPSTAWCYESAVRIASATLQVAHYELCFRCLALSPRRRGERARARGEVGPRRCAARGRGKKGRLDFLYVMKAKN